jgi:hypothetical protein
MRSVNDLPLQNKYQIFRCASDGTWKPVGGLIFNLLASAEKCVSRSRESLQIRELGR